MSRTALILAAHGSRDDRAVNEVLRDYARQLAALDLFQETTVAFHHGRPHFHEVLDRLGADEVVVVPVMTSEGYYAEEVLPRELSRARRFRDVRLRITRPVGTHPGMVTLVAGRVGEVLRSQALDPTETTLALVGHGTERNARSRSATIDLARSLEPLGLCHEVLVAFLDEEPLVETLLKRATRRQLLVIPFLISAGPHSIYDTPRRLGMDLEPGTSPPLVQRVGDRLIVCDAAIGLHPGILPLIIDLAKGALRPTRPRHAGATDELRLGTRNSRLALVQALHVAERLRTTGVEVRLVEIDTSGDRDQRKAIDQLPSESPFTDDIDRALVDDRIDLAVHSLKDMPLHPSPELRTAAVLARADAAEVLVSRNGERLAELPRGALVGTSSARRMAQLLALRADLRPMPIRGPVDERVRQVLAGRFDAAVLALAGLVRLNLMETVAERFEIQTFLPAPGQGALAVQVRADDHRTHRLVSVLNDELAYRTTLTELELLRLMEHTPGFVAAAFADVVSPVAQLDSGNALPDVSSRLRLRARLIALDGSSTVDVEVFGDEPLRLARKAAIRLDEERTPVAEPAQ